MSIAGLGDATLASRGAAGVFAGVKANKGHELTRIVETGQIPKLRGDGDGDMERNAAERLECLANGRETPRDDMLLQFLHQPFNALHVLLDGDQAFLKDDALWDGGKSNNVNEPT